MAGSAGTDPDQSNLTSAAVGHRKRLLCGSGVGEEVCKESKYKVFGVRVGGGLAGRERKEGVRGKRVQERGEGRERVVIAVETAIDGERRGRRDRRTR